MSELSTFKTFFVLEHAVREILRISVPAVTKAQLGPLDVHDADNRLRAWARRLLKRVNAQLVVTGQEHVDVSTGPYVTVSNHQSLYDIPILFEVLPLSLRMAAKKELFDLPVWGRAMTAAGFVKIDRGNRKKAYRALNEAAKRMKEQGISLHIAPEGTRSLDGTLGEFKRGAFTIAKMMGFPILPIAIDGAIRIHRSGAKTVSTDEEVTVSILEPVSPSDFDSLEALQEEVRSRIAAALGQSAASNQSGLPSQSQSQSQSQG